MRASARLLAGTGGDAGPLRRRATPAGQRRRVRLARLLLPLLLAAASGAGLASGPLRVVVTLAPYADLVQRVGGELVSVDTLLPPGASPHAFDPTPSQAAGLATSDLIVMNGGLDAWLERLVSAAAPRVPVLVVLEGLHLRPPAGEEHDDHEVHGEGEDDHGHGLSTVNPHVWLDPALMIEAGRLVASELSSLDPENAGAYEAGYERLAAALAALDAEIAATLAPVRGSPFVPFHDAWPYFAQRYGLNLVLSIEPFPGREPSPRYVAEAVAAVRSVGAKAVFAERQLNPKSAEVIAESAGVKVAVLDPIGGAPGPVGYDELLRYNAAVILSALR